MEVLVDDIRAYIFHLTLMLRWKDVPIKRETPPYRITKDDDENRIIEDYNFSIIDMWKQAKTLTRWEYYVVFEGQKYGLEEISMSFDTQLGITNVHNRDNCGGDVSYNPTVKCNKCTYFDTL